MKNFFLNDPNLLVYGFAMVFFASFGQTFYIALFNDDIRNLYKITDGEFGLVYAIATLVSSFLFINFFKLSLNLLISESLSSIKKLVEAKLSE